MTISEIAKMAGVSAAAVSRYLNGGSLSAEKRALIKETIDRTGYKPDAYAQLMRTKRMRQVGVVVPKINSDSISAVTEGISQELSRAEYLCLLAFTDNHEEKELDYMSLFQANHVAGIILAGTVLTPRHEEYFKQMQVPLVVVGQRHKSLPCIYHDDYHAARDLTDLILARGRRHLGYIGVIERDVAVGQSRRRGFLSAVREQGMAEGDTRYAQSNFTMEGGYGAMLELLKQDPKLDGIVCATDTLAVGAIRALRDRGRTVPGDVSVVGVGDSRVGRISEPPLTTAHFYYRSSGEDAAKMLLSILQDEKQPVKQTMLGYDILKRGSV